MKIFNRNSIAIFLYYTGILYLLKVFTKLLKPLHPLIVMGHRILPDNFNGNEIDTFSLDSRHALPISELKKRLKLLDSIRDCGDPIELLNTTKNSDKYYLTFDDGYNDNIKYAGPILKHQNKKAIIFIIKDIFNDNTIVPWWDSLSSKSFTDKKLSTEIYSKMCISMKSTFKGIASDTNYLYRSTEKEDTNRYIHAIDDNQSNVFYFGNHTCTHPNLSRLKSNQVFDEITSTHNWLKQFNNYLPILAYPFGFSDKETRDIVRKIDDIPVALATSGGNYEDIYNIRRINLNATSYPLFYAECLNLFYYINIILKKLKI